MKHTIYHDIPRVDLTAPQNEPIGFWSVVVPIERTNLITNPSVELATTGYTAVGGSIARSTTRQYHGAYSLAVTPTAGTADGVYYGTMSLTSGTTYAVSCKVYGAAGVPYKLSVATTGGVDLVSYRFTGVGRWQWVWLIWTETSSTTRRIYITKSGSASTAVFYIDGLQCEACESGNYWPTTYIDGDQRGLVANQFPPAYYWTGTPHASTSVRSGQTRAGGRVMNLQTAFRFLITAVAGLGLAIPAHQALTFSLIDGGQYQQTVVPPRQFSLSGILDAETPAQLRRLRSDLEDALGYDAVGLRQPIRLIYQHYRCRDAAGDACDIIATYDGGLEGLDNNPVRDTLTISFTQYLPLLTAGEAGTALTVQQSVANANYIIQRSPSGIWSALSTGMNGLVNVLAIGPDGALYAGGDFTTAGGGAANRIAKWDGSSWSALGTAFNNQVRALAFGPDGTLYAGGSFTTADGAAAQYIAKWNGSAWSTVGTATDLNSTVYALAIGDDGVLYVGGNFTNAAGIAAADYIAKWNGSVWSALGTGGNDIVYTISQDQAGMIYAGGNFTSMGGVSGADYIAKWNGSVWSALSTGANSLVYGSVIGPDNTLYIGGSFTTVGGVAANRAARWNGTAWSPLGAGVDNLIRGMSLSPFGTLYAGGSFASAGGIALPDHVAEWNGSTWTSIGVDLPGSPNVNGVVVRSDGTLFLGYATSGSATAAAVTTLTNASTARTYPTLVIKGPTSGTSRIYQIKNHTTGRSIFFNYTINAGETAVLAFEPTNITFTSDFRGNIMNKILPGSNTAEFFLQPGTNNLSFLAAGATVTATLRWPVTYKSLNDATW